MNTFYNTLHRRQLLVDNFKALTSRGLCSLSITRFIVLDKYIAIERVSSPQSFLNFYSCPSTTTGRCWYRYRWFWFLMPSPAEHFGTRSRVRRRNTLSRGVVCRTDEVSFYVWYVPIIYIHACIWRVDGRIVVQFVCEREKVMLKFNREVNNLSIFLYFWNTVEEIYNQKIK